MDLLSILQGRRSVRRYQDRPVDDQDLQKVLEAVRWSPSWANTQCWEVVVVDKAEIKADLAETLPPTNPARKAMTEAPLVLALCARLKAAGYYKGEATTKFGDWFMYDLGIATQSLCLMAHSLGLGTVIVGLFDHNKAASILGIPDGYELVSLIPLGYPAHEPKAPSRKEVGEFLHLNRF